MTTTRRSGASRASRAAVPPLENGDRLTRREFHERYLQHPEIKKAELIEGVVYMPSPTRAQSHGFPHADIATWLGMYRAGHPGVRAGDDTTVILDDDNEPKPDLLLCRVEGGAVHFEDDYLVGPPELVVEISASSVSYDSHAKKETYRRNGVPEYLIWRVWDGEVDWFRLRDGVYAPLAPDANGVIESEAFPGLRLHVPKLLAGDLGGVVAELDTPPS